eukprot:m.122604 g.122604  ORF g.122604 m.122604 type:complete len:457 (+) comp28934_c0_seq1:220-1590(+)
MTGTATLQREQDQIAARAQNAMSGSAPMEVDVTDLIEELDGIDELAKTDLAAAMAKYTALVAEPLDPTDEASVRRKEMGFTRAATLYGQHHKCDDLKALIELAKPFMLNISKAKGGKLFRVLLEKYLETDAATESQVTMCAECIEWTKSTNRRFLRQALEIVLTSLHIKARQFQESLKVAQPLIRELKKFDDKLQLVEVQLMESRAYYALSNYPKSRAALVSGRTTANAIYCPPKLQAELDIMSGIVHAQEQDFKTGFSYFYESFEGFDSTDCPSEAVSALKYMLLCKIMTGEADAVPGIVSGKLALKYTTGEDARVLEAMQAVAKANLRRSLGEFEAAMTQYKTELGDDIIIQSHVKDMYEDMLMNNLCRIVEPYSCVEIDHIAKLISLPRETVELKLSQMILDKKLRGILDQNADTLEVYENEEDDKAYTDALQTINHTAQVVESLFVKAQKLV